MNADQSSRGMGRCAGHELIKKIERVSSLLSLWSLNVRAQFDARDMPSFIRYSTVARFVQPECVSSRIISEAKRVRSSIRLETSSHYLSDAHSHQWTFKWRIVHGRKDGQFAGKNGNTSHRARLTYLRGILCWMRLLFIYDEEKQTALLVNKTSLCCSPWSMFTLSELVSRVPALIATENQRRKAHQRNDPATICSLIQLFFFVSLGSDSDEFLSSLTYVFFDSHSHKSYVLTMILKRIDILICKRSE